MKGAVQLLAVPEIKSGLFVRLYQVAQEFGTIVTSFQTLSSPSKIIQSYYYVVVEEIPSRISGLAHVRSAGFWGREDESRTTPQSFALHGCSTYPRRQHTSPGCTIRVITGISYVCNETLYCTNTIVGRLSLPMLP